MSKEQKIQAILLGAASAGWPDGVYRNEIDELRAAGKIMWRVSRLHVKWFLV